MPVPPPTMRDRRCPNRCRRASAITGSRLPTCRLDAVGSKPTYAVTCSRREHLGQPLGRVVDHAAPRELFEQILSSDCDLLYQSMLITRRATAEGAASQRARAQSPGWRSYGFLYERHALGTTSMTLPVAGLPPALAGLRIGLLTDIHRSRWVLAEDVERGVSALMAAQPDLIVLGGDYVTWGDRQYRRPVGRGARRGSTRRTASSPSSATTTTITTCRRRLSRAACADAEGRANRSRDPRRNAVELAGIRFWTRRRRGHRAGRSAAPRHGDAAGPRSAPPDRSRGAEASRWSCRATRTAARSCCRRSAPSRRRNFRSSPAWPASRTPRCSSAADWERCTCRFASTARRKSPC